MPHNNHVNIIIRYQIEPSIEHLYMQFIISTSTLFLFACTLVILTSDKGTQVICVICTFIVCFSCITPCHFLSFVIFSSLKRTSLTSDVVHIISFFSPYQMPYQFLSLFCNNFLLYFLYKIHACFILKCDVSFLIHPWCLWHYLSRYVTRRLQTVTSFQTNFYSYTPV